jgi:type VI protein secretion system component VasK
LNDPELSIAPIGTSGKNTNALFREKVSDEKIKVENKAEDLKEIISDTLRQAKEKTIDSLKQSIKNKTTDILDSLSSKNGSKLDSMFNKILKDSTSSPIKDQIKKEENKIKNALEKWNPLKKKKKPDTTKINF